MRTRGNRQSKTEGRRSGFTLIELLVVISIIMLLMAILIPSLRKAREQAKRVVCQSNQHQIMVAWYQYTTDFKDRLVNGNTGSHVQGTAPATGENCWVGLVGRWKWAGLVPDETPEEQIYDIKVGTLWSYTQNPGLYRCPSMMEDVMRNYSIVDRMNGWDPSQENHRIIRMTSRIRDAGSQLVLIDDGQQTAHSWTSYWDNPEWMEPISTRHTDGSTFAFADGHVEHWAWTHENTKLVGAMTLYQYLEENRFEWNMDGGDDNKDLYKIQEGVWGRGNLEYELGDAP